MKKKKQECVYCKKCNRKMEYSLFDLEGGFEEVWKCGGCNFICSLDYPSSFENTEVEIRKKNK